MKVFKLWSPLSIQAVLFYIRAKSKIYSVTGIFRNIFLYENNYFNMCQLLYFLYSFCKHLFCQFPIMFCFYFLQGITDLFGTVCYILIFWCWDNSHVEVQMVSFHTYALFANLKQLCKRFFYFLFLKDGTVICATILKSGINVYRFENFNNENWWTADQKRCAGFFLIIFSFLQKRKFFSGGWSKKFWGASI